MMGSKESSAAATVSTSASRGEEAAVFWMGCTEGDVGRRSDQSEGVADTLNLPEEGEQHHVVELENHNGWSASYSVGTSQRTR